MKKKKGISLIVLVITIVVMIILAGAVIINLNNSGIIDRAKEGVVNYSENETCQLIYTSYLEYQIEKIDDKSLVASNFLKEKLESYYGDNNVELLSPDNPIIFKIKKNGISEYYEYNATTSKAMKIPNGINFNGKEKAEIVVGDDISIVTEKFKVFSVANNVIKALPYHNITLTEDHPVQSSKAGKSFFSTTKYWSETEEWSNLPSNSVVDVDMEDTSNLIQKYIMAYKTTLEGFGARQIEVRACKQSEVPSSNSIRSNLPINADFWLSSVNSSHGDVYYWNSRSHGLTLWSYNDGYWRYGVRPIIIIPIE